MYDKKMNEAERFIYVFTGMNLYEYADKLLKEFQNEAEKLYRKSSPIDDNIHTGKLHKEINNLEERDILYTVSETAKLIKSNPSYVYSLIKAGRLSVLKLGSYKIRRSSLIEFLDKYEGWDISDPSNPKRITF